MVRDGTHLLDVTDLFHDAREEGGDEPGETGDGFKLKLLEGEIGGRGFERGGKTEGVFVENRRVSREESGHRSGEVSKTAGVGVAVAVGAKHCRIRTKF